MMRSTARMARRLSRPTRPSGRSATAPRFPTPHDPGQPCPPTAQHAIRQGRLVAHNVACALRGRPAKPFRYKTKGVVAELGARQAVAITLGIRWRGFPAWLIARTYHLLLMPGLGRRLRLLVDWNVALLFGRDSSSPGRLGSPTPLAPTHRRPPTDRRGGTRTRRNGAIACGAEKGGRGAYPASRWGSSSRSSRPEGRDARLGRRRRSGALRLVLSELQKAAKEGNDDELAVLRRERKRRLEAASAFRDGGREDLAGGEEAEAELIGSYLPAELSDEELQAIVAPGRQRQRRRIRPKDMGDRHAAGDGRGRRSRRRQARLRAGARGPAGMRTQIELPNEVAAELAGSQDAVLRALESHLPCRVFLRGNLLTLRRGGGSRRSSASASCASSPT